MRAIAARIVGLLLAGFVLTTVVGCSSSSPTTSSTPPAAAPAPPGTPSPGGAPVVGPKGNQGGGGVPKHLGEN